MMQEFNTLIPSNQHKQTKTATGERPYFSSGRLRRYGQSLAPITECCGCYCCCYCYYHWLFHRSLAQLVEEGGHRVLAVGQKGTDSRARPSHHRQSRKGGREGERGRDG